MNGGIIETQVLLETEEEIERAESCRLFITSLPPSAVWKEGKVARKSLIMIMMAPKFMFVQRGKVYHVEEKL